MMKSAKIGEFFLFRDPEAKLSIGKVTSVKVSLGLSFDLKLFIYRTKSYSAMHTCHLKSFPRWSAGHTTPVLNSLRQMTNLKSLRRI